MGTRAAPRVLIVTGTFAVPGGNPWLVDDLVTELAHQGALVDVVVADPKNARPRGAGPSPADGVRVWSAGPERSSSSRAGTWLAYAGLALRLNTRGMRLLRSQHYDLCVFTSIALTTAGLPARVRRAGIADRLLLVLWDFFPVHHVQIGRVPGAAEGVLKAAERAAIDACDVVAVMSPRNAEFLRGYHEGLRASTVSLPPWSAGQAVEPRTEAPPGPFRAVFGGQITAGRGIDTLVDAAALLQDRAADVIIDIYGWGPQRAQYEASAAERGIDTVQFHDPLPREDYRRRLADSHAGIAVTVPGVTVPSFPSKIVDYCQSGLPVIACVETTTDVGDIVRDAGAGSAVAAGDAAALADAIEAMAGGRDTGVWTAMSASALNLFTSQLSASAAAARIIGVATDASLPSDGLRAPTKESSG